MVRDRQIQIGLMLESRMPNAVSPIARYSAYREWRWVNGNPVDNELLCVHVDCTLFKIV
jgi:hypothetical protein